MDRQKFLTSEQLCDGLELVHRFSEIIPVEVAFWFNYVDHDQFFLNIASSEVNPSNHFDAFVVLLSKINELDSPYLDPGEIDLIESDALMTQKAILLRQGHVGITRSASHNLSYRGAPLDQLYIYSERHLQLGVFNG